jgi:hypothetical protein
MPEVSYIERNKILFIQGLSFELIQLAKFFGVLPVPFEAYKPYMVMGMANELSSEDMREVCGSIQSEDGVENKVYDFPEELMKSTYEVLIDHLFIAGVKLDRARTLILKVNQKQSVETIHH